MKYVDVVFTDFNVLTGNGHSQAAAMVVPPHDSVGGSDNRHRGADQWLYVAAGQGHAIVNGKKYRLAPYSLVLIEHGDIHEIHNDGDEAMHTLNIYVPPAYTLDEQELPAGKS